MSFSASAPWLAHYGNTPSTLDYSDKTMYQLLSETAAKHPRHTAYIFQGKSTTYDRFMAGIEAAARAFSAIGIQAGDTVALCLPNCPQALDCFYGLNRLGAIACMIHPLSAPQEIAFYLNTSHAKAVITLEPFYETVSSALPQVSYDCIVLVAKTADGLPFPKNLLYPLTRAGHRKLPKQGYLPWKHALIAGTDILQLPKGSGHADDCAAILYSGGTTGTPKGIRLSSRNFNALGLQTIAASGLSSVAGMKMLSVLPIFHGFGLGIGIHTALIGGATCVLVPQFHPRSFARLLLKEKPNILPGVPTLFEALLRLRALDGKDLSFLKGIFCGGDRLSPKLRQQINVFLWQHHCTEQIREGYGTTECVAASCLMPRHLTRNGSIGIPLPDTFYKIVTPGTALEVPAGTDGEICISGPTVMLGYLNSPKDTAATLQTHADGKIWLHTGDLGSMDNDGFLHFRQRIKRMIVTSGYNVYPTQLENILQAHPQVAKCCCIGVADAYLGQRVRVYVVAVPDAAPTEALRQALLAHCAQRIAKYALPRELIFRADLPVTPLGKVDYQALEAEARQEARP